MNPQDIKIPSTNWIRSSGLFHQDVLDFIDAWDGIPSKPSKQTWKLGRMQVLKNDFAEKYFGVAHPITPGFVFLPPAALCMHGALQWGISPAMAALGFVLGIFLWTLGEYIVHRYLFHSEHMANTPTGKFFLFMLHGYHHVFPQDRLRLVMPPLMAIPLGVLFWITERALFGPDFWAPVFSGTLVGYVAYDWIHYYSHHASPKRGIGRFFKDYHFEHHFKHWSLHYGVSTPLWDWVVAKFSKNKNWKKPESTPQNFTE